MTRSLRVSRVIRVYIGGTLEGYMIRRPKDAVWGQIYKVLRYIYIYIYIDYILLILYFDLLFQIDILQGMDTLFWIHVLGVIGSLFFPYAAVLPSLNCEQYINRV